MALPAGGSSRLGKVIIGAERPLAVWDRWLRRFEQWSVRHFAIVAAIVLLLVAVNEVWYFGLNPADWDLMYVTGFTVLVLGLWLGLRIPLLVRPTLESLHDRGALRGNPAGLAESVVGRGDRWAHEGGLVIAGAVVLAFVVAFWGTLWFHSIFIGVAAVAAYFVGRVVGRMVAIGTLGSIVNAEPSASMDPTPFHPDGTAGLKPVGELYLRQASVLLIPAVFFAVWWILIPVVDSFERYEPWRAPYMGLLLLTVVVEMLAFVLPMMSFHRQMRRRRDELVRASERRINPRIVHIHETIAFVSDPHVRYDLKEQSRLLQEHLTTVEKMPTWPVDVSVRRRFTFRNALLLVPVLGRLIGLSTVWTDLSNPLREIFGNGA